MLRSRLLAFTFCRVTAREEWLLVLLGHGQDG